jgi:hypothetical protein
MFACAQGVGLLHANVCAINYMQDTDKKADMETNYTYYELRIQSCCTPSIHKDYITKQYTSVSMT